MRNYFLSIGLYIIFVSSLSGQIWAPTNGPSGLELSDFVLSSDDVWVASATNQGIYFSFDKGTTWIKKSLGLYRSNSYATSLAAGPDGIIYALIDDELYRLERDMDEWDKTIHKFENGKLYANPNGTLFVVVRYFEVSIYISKDKGNAFKSILPSGYDFISSFSLNGNNNNYFIDARGQDNKLFKISDDGNSITTLRTFTGSLSDLIWHPKGKLFIFNPSEGLTRLDSNGNFEKSIQGMLYQSRGVFVKPDGSLLVISYEEAYSSADLGDSWLKLSSNLFNLYSFSFLNFTLDNTIIHFTLYCNSLSLQSSNDEGNSWINHSYNFKNLPYYDILINDSTNTIYSLNCRTELINFSRDKGASWQKLSIPWKTFWNFSFSSSGKLFLNDHFQSIMSEDHGASWKIFTIPDEERIVRVVGDNNLHFIAQGLRNSYISIDGAKSWQKVNGQFDEEISKLYFDTEGVLYAILDGSPNRIYISEDMGLNWNPSELIFDYLSSFTLLRNGEVLISGREPTTNQFGLFISEDKLKTSIYVSSESFDKIVQDNNGFLYGFNSSNICMSSLDLGKTWKPFINGLPTPNRIGSYDLTGGLALDSDQYMYLGYNNNVVYKTIGPLTSIIYSKNNALQISLHNNVVDQYLFLKSQTETIKVDRISIIDQMGRIFANLKTPIFESGLLKLEVNQLSCGIYFLNVQTEDGNITIHKFIKTL